MMTLLSTLLYLDPSDWGSPSDFADYGSSDGGGGVWGVVLFIGLIIVFGIAEGGSDKDDSK